MEHCLLNEFEAMNPRLLPGQNFKTVLHNRDVNIDAFLSVDSTGEMYRITLDGKPAALKLFSELLANGKRFDATKQLIEAGAPDENFLWPVEMIRASHLGSDCFGYIVALPEASMQSFESHEIRMTAAGFKATILTCVNLARSFANLHAHGYCFHSVRLKNLFLHPSTAKIAICDNENLAIDEDANSAMSRPSKFSAPEVVQEKSAPSVRTDLYLLASLLFYLLFKNHPLEGSLSTAGKQEFYGGKALFIFDPQDRSNAPKPGQNEVSLIWKITPKFLRDLFSASFTEGLHDGYKRVPVSTWCHQMMRLHDSIFYCQQCSKPNFHCKAKIEPGGVYKEVCWACSGQLRSPTRIKIGDLVIALNPDTKLYAYHIDSNHSFEFTRPMGTVTHLPADPRYYGLRNDGLGQWACKDASGAVLTVLPGKICPLIPGSIIEFGRKKGEVRA